MFRQLNDKAFLVGGAVRDKLLGKTPHDADYVLACTEEEFRKIFPEVPQVGNSFPVYNIGGHEVALTRTERCTGSSYQSYEVTGVGVSIEEDLKRRDYTINSIAEHYVTGAIVDPLGGADDLTRRILRCANPNAYSDDPLRIYRGLRFATNFGLSIDGYTRSEMTKNAYRLADVKPERVVLELEKLWNYGNKVSTFFYLLTEIDGMKYHFGPLANAHRIPAGPYQYHGMNSLLDHIMETVDKAKEANLSFSCFISMLMHDAGKATTQPN